MLPELKIMFVAMSPILELRGAVPIGLEIYRLPILSVLFFSIIGNLIPIVFLLLFLEPMSDFLSERSRVLKKFFFWLFERTRANQEKKFSRWEKFALFLLVAVPLPFTGGWTGSICAFLFKIPFRHAFPLIALGILSAAVIVALITLAAFQI